MAETLTYEQRQAVENRGGKLLVSAAAGSGKTKVLVDRLMSYILDSRHPANIDDFLIITYTKAAASELRGKIASKLSELIANSPHNKHLQQQMQRLYLAKISTVHGFCGDILRQYAYRLDISSDFRVAEESECLQLQLNALDKVLNNAYDSAENDSSFYAFVDSQGMGRDDRQIPEIILKVYQSARCHLNPDQWLSWCVAEQSNHSDAAQTPWGKYLVDDLKSYLKMQIDAFNRCIAACSVVQGMEKPVALFASTVTQLQSLLASETWDEVIQNKNIDFGRLTFPKNCNDIQLVDQMKAIRNACKDGLAKRLRNFADDSERVLEDLNHSIDAARGLVQLVRNFAEEYSKLKKNRGILDFGDLEHMTLDLFLGKNRSGITSIASEVGNNFREVMVDEYQDSNEIQDAIFCSLTENRQNCFMVGDVKQSIYQFRLADPGIFIDKYNTYLNVEDAKPPVGRKVLLSHNFRSSGGVISAVNDIFSQCMSDDVGGLCYGEQEMLREGVSHIPLHEPEVSLFGIDVDCDTYAEEADFVANKICSLLDGTHYIRNKDQLRVIQPEDVVILLRSPGSVGAVFQSALEKNGVRCITGDSTDLLHNEEIATIRAILQVIYNPLQDIPLVSVLTSPVFGFTADELAILRSNDSDCDIYNMLCASEYQKCKSFLGVLNRLRECARLMSVTELISEIFEKTNVLKVYGAMVDGGIKHSNLQTFFQIASDYENNGPKELGRFLDYLDSVEERGLVTSVGQQEKGAVSIMSIHKSKGLEYPVVFLCGLSRSFNQESARAQVLCHKDLGLGLDCFDAKLRVRYPTIAKRAISTKILREGVSEEMRVLYVALTRARDILFMTYATRNLSDNLQEIAMRLDMSSGPLLASDADCPGWWVLQSALTRTEAGAFFSLSGHPDCACVRDSQWNIQLAETIDHNAYVADNIVEEKAISMEQLRSLSSALHFSYANDGATKIPSKLTATQLKGRSLDTEISEGTETIKQYSFRKAGVSKSVSGTVYGSTVHTVLQHICYESCGSIDCIHSEIARLIREGFITSEQADMVDCECLFRFFDSALGKRIRNANHILREFKFSVLDDANNYYPNITGEQILLQGVVDLALIEDDGIIILDFKTDRVTEDTLLVISQKYESQVRAYANALARIYQKPVKSAMLYFFALNRYVDII